MVSLTIITGGVCTDIINLGNFSTETFNGFTIQTTVDLENLEDIAHTVLISIGNMWVNVDDNGNHK